MPSVTPGCLHLNTLRCSLSDRGEVKGQPTACSRASGGGGTCGSADAARINTSDSARDVFTGTVYILNAWGFEWIILHCHLSMRLWQQACPQLLAAGRNAPPTLSSISPVTTLLVADFCWNYAEHKHAHAHTHPFEAPQENVHVLTSSITATKFCFDNIMWKAGNFFLFFSVN